MSEERSQGRIINIDEGLVKSQLGELVRETVEQTLNTMLDAEADLLCSAKRYERSNERVDRRAGHYERTMQTKAGPVKLNMPKLRTIPFESAICLSYSDRPQVCRGYPFYGESAVLINKKLFLYTEACGYHEDIKKSLTDNSHDSDDKSTEIA